LLGLVFHTVRKNPAEPESETKVQVATSSQRNTSSLLEEFVTSNNYNFLGPGPGRRGCGTLAESEEEARGRTQTRRGKNPAHSRRRHRRVLADATFSGSREQRKPGYLGAIFAGTRRHLWAPLLASPLVTSARATHPSSSPVRSEFRRGTRR